MIRVGIITHYYNSNNYGGVLQAYALCNVIDAMGFDVKQISYDLTYDLSMQIKKERISKVDKIKMHVSGIRHVLINKVRSFNFDKRIARTREFREIIPHTDYCDSISVRKITKDITIFIAGSDQVWNPNCFRKDFFLDFAKKNDARISYAASLSVNQLIDIERDTIIPLIQKINFISVRESSAEKIIQPYLDKDVKVTLDPTLLLTQTQWDTVAVTPTISQPYIFVYLLGNNRQHRIIIKEIAHSLDYKIAFIPHVNFNYEKNDTGFADVEIYDAGPAEFVGWIKNAEMVITDSFHGCVFSILYEKKFWALKRTSDSDPDNMNSRLYDLFKSLDFNNRFLESVDYQNNRILTQNIDYKKVTYNLELLRHDSLDWLSTALKESKKSQVKL